ncbi:hypothetical protein EHS39_28600 [Ensifer sp. MPMI2T]|nr:hypothetical protein EHS39_28600 [Ensifer sp. MPMI2T]
MSENGTAVQAAQGKTFAVFAQEDAGLRRTRGRLGRLTGQALAARKRPREELRTCRIWRRLHWSITISAFPGC